MEQICPRPVKNRHEIISNYLYPELRQIPQSLLIILNVLVSGGKADLNVIMDIHTLHHIHVEAGALDLLTDLLNLLHGPHLACLLMMQSPDQSGHSRNLLDVLGCDAVIPFAIPTKCHLHKLLLPS